MSHCGTWFTRIGLRASTSMKRSSTPYGGSDSLKFPSSEAIHTYGASSRNSFPSSVCRVRFRVQVVAQEQKLANSVLQQSRARPFAPTGSLWLGSVPVHIVSRDFLVSKAHRVRARRPIRCYPAEPSFRTGKLAREPFTLLPQSLHGLVVFTFVANTHTTSHTLGSRVLLGLAANRDLQVYSPSDP